MSSPTNQAYAPCPIVFETIRKGSSLGSGASCHVGYRSCFYRRIPVGDEVAGGPDDLVYMEEAKTFDPQEVYGDAPNPTQL